MVKKRHLCKLVSLKQFICRSKELIQILNRMGLCMSYNEVERLDNNLALRTIKKAGVHRVPVPPSIQPGLLIHGAMEKTQSLE